MYIDVVFTPGELPSRDISGKTAVVIDVLRATSTIIYAFWGYKKNNIQEIQGCSKIIPVETLEEARNLKKQFDPNKVLITGERFCIKPDDFDLGNSPDEYLPEKVKGKTIIFSTTNGTRALKTAEKNGAKYITTASFVNATACANDVINQKNDIVILCAGRSNKTTKEDSACAGLLVELIFKRCIDNRLKFKLSDSADIAVKFFNYYREDIYGLLKSSEAGQNLIDVKLGKDLYDCCIIDLLPIQTLFNNGEIHLKQ